MEKKVGILILATGGSRRLGKAKQLLSFNNRTLLGHTIQVAQQCCPQEILVVIGARQESIVPVLGKIDYIVNKQWKKGMGNSLAEGISELQKRKVDACVLLLCDQPHISSSLISEMIEEAEKSNKGIIASDYGDGCGPPCYFSKKYFAELAKLDGDEGAKKIVRENPDDVQFVSFEEGKIDIDSVEDVAKYLS